LEELSGGDWVLICLLKQRLHAEFKNASDWVIFFLKKKVDGLARRSNQPSLKLRLIKAQAG
jgi:hypothetical protein